MIYSAPAEQLTALLNGAEPDLVGILTVQIERYDGSTHTPATTSGIVEIEPAVYVANLLAPGEAGTYAVVWKSGDISGSEELVVTFDLPGPVPPPVEGIEPTVQEVANLLRARTSGGAHGMTEIGTFNATTRPTADQVTSLITTSVSEILTRTGTVCEVEQKDRLEGRQRQMAALYAAMLIELSYFPEQVGSNKSPYSEYKKLYDEGMDALTEAVSEACGGGDGESVGTTSPQASFDFGPYDSVGRDTVW